MDFFYKNKHISIFFGNADYSVSLEAIHQHMHVPEIEYVQKELGAHQVIFVKQVHGNQGLHIVEQDDQNQIARIIGDFIITQKKRCGIAVTTADCLPIVLHDVENKAIAIIHAGWKGIASNIFQTALQAMQNTFETKFASIEMFLGPAAQACCYEVQQDFIDRFEVYKNDFNLFFIKKNDKTYFDLRSFVIVLARNLGINEEKIYTRYNVCTICDLSFCSYRREKEKARRQITMVCLH